MPDPEVWANFDVQIERFHAQDGDWLSFLSVLNLLLTAADAFESMSYTEAAHAFRFLANMLSSGEETQGRIPPKHG